MRKILILIPLFLMACSDRPLGLDQLGKYSNFSDAEIPEDFSDPAEDSEPDNSSNSEDSGEVVEIVDPTNTFYLEDQLFSLAHGKAQRWDGCRKDYVSQGGYNSDTQCGRAFFHPNFASQLNEFFFRCIMDAAQVAGYAQPMKIFIRHLGSYVDRNARNSTRLSNHA
ncbi:MAG: hypothetical protein KDD33_06105, partial [Bdellovibrionales bacterium]|nr:hypothetical protein [Bdellovibrionales bacterium]